MRSFLFVGVAAFFLAAAAFYGGAALFGLICGLFANSRAMRSA